MYIRKTQYRQTSKEFQGNGGCIFCIIHVEHNINYIVIKETSKVVMHIYVIEYNHNVKYQRNSVSNMYIKDIKGISRNIYVCLYASNIMWASKEFKRQ